MVPSLLTLGLQVAGSAATAPARDGLTTAALVADIVLTVVVVLLLGGLVVLLFQLRGIHRSVTGLLGRVEKKLDPVIDRTRDVAANVDFISAAVRTDVQRVSDSVRSLAERLQSASDRMEQRVQEFNALMEVVQSEAEDIFISSAATMRGVRAGARALRDGDGADEYLDEDDVELADEAGLAPRALGPAAMETDLAPDASPGGVALTGHGEPRDDLAAKTTGDVGKAGRRAGA
jgi:ABC-type multidrug transport system fused ATPase/permease subunit